MRARRLFIAGALVALWGLSTAGSAQGCSCVPMPPSEAMRQADAAIVGRLVRIVPRPGFRADYRYEVQGVYLGGGRIRRGQVVSVRSASRPAACALPHGIDRSYGLFLIWGEGRWTGGICGVVKPRQLRSAARSRAPSRARASGSIGACGG